MSGKTTIILDPDFSSDEVSASLDTLHRTGNAQQLALVLGLAGSVEERAAELSGKDETCFDLGLDEDGSPGLQKDPSQAFVDANNVQEVEGMKPFLGDEDPFENFQNKAKSILMLGFGKSTSQPKNLPFGERTKKKREKYHCELCGKILVVYSLEQHMRSMHTVKERKTKPVKMIKCNVCQQQVRDGWNLTRHMNNVHSVVGNISCTKDFCDSTFESEYDMKVRIFRITSF